MKSETWTVSGHSTIEMTDSDGNNQVGNVYYDLDQSPIHRDDNGCVSTRITTDIVSDSGTVLGSAIIDVEGVNPSYDDEFVPETGLSNNHLVYETNVSISVDLDSGLVLTAPPIDSIDTVDALIQVKLPDNDE